MAEHTEQDQRNGRPDTLTCEVCHQDFTVQPRGPLPTACSGTCRRRRSYARAKQDGRARQWAAAEAARRKAVPVEKTCPHCAAHYSTVFGAVTCGAAECRKAYHRERMRDYLRQRAHEQRRCEGRFIFSCAYCGTLCAPGENVSWYARQFCSVKCKRGWHNARAPRVVRGPTCRVRTPEVRTWISGPCRECGTIVTTRSDLATGWCSRKCSRRDRRRRRRARKAGVGYKTLGFRTVAERDGWVCQLCGGAVDSDLAWPDPMCATLDHVIPLSAGGEHTEANGQLAHWRCNTLKGDGLSATAIGSQIAMI